MMTKVTTISTLALLICEASAFTMSGNPAFTSRTTSSLAAKHYTCSRVEMSDVTNEVSSSTSSSVDVPSAEPLSTATMASVEEAASESTSKATPTTTTEPPKSPKKKAGKGKGGGAIHQEGVFSPLVFVAKDILGDDQLSKLRAKVISLHSDAIATFVDTSSTPIGQATLRQLFELMDKNKDGVLDEEELKEGLNALGFYWLEDKQIAGIVKRSDLDENGVIDYEEFEKAAPKTLRTNLTKLAKKNGGEMGLLV